VVPTYELYDYNPVADPLAVVTSGNARFTILTSKLIRMEYAESGTFEDRATIAFVHRKLSVPKYTLAIADGALTIETAAVTLTYKVGQPFKEDTLLVEPSTKSTKSKLKRWTPGASKQRVDTQRSASSGRLGLRSRLV
jgi:hypothetical protein